MVKSANFRLFRIILNYKFSFIFIVLLEIILTFGLLVRLTNRFKANKQNGEFYI